ncbi:MAG: hypothetical protein ACP5MC_03410 [Candidatus Micrarchaeia archaeon]
MATLLTIDTTKKLRPVHLQNRRIRVSKIVKREVAKRLKISEDQVKLTSTLNKHLLMHFVKNPKKLRLSIESKEGKTIVDVYKQHETAKSGEGEANAKGEKKEAKPKASVTKANANKQEKEKAQ